MAERKAKDILAELRKRYKRCVEHERKNRADAMAALKFANIKGEQWEESVKSERGKDRPMFEFNRARVTNKRVINDMRANRPQGKVRGSEDGDKDTAEVYEGLCRNIWNNSDGDTVIDYAAEYQVGGGMGAWRVITKYASDTAFDQDIMVESIKNPFCLYADSTSQDPLKRDAQYWILTDKISRESFESRYPKAKPVNFEEDGDSDNDDEEWGDTEWVRIAEYWWKEPKAQQLLLLSNGATVESDKLSPEQIQAAGLQIVRTRDVQGYQVKMAICSGNALLEGPTEWAGREFPFVIVYGEYMIIDGRTHWSGLTQQMIDSQRAHNWALTSVFESIAGAPTAKYWATAEQAANNVTQWSEANAKNLPFMLYNVDPKVPGPPPRVGGADVPVALMQAAQMSGDELKATSGIFDASLGQKSNETTGIAIRARQAQGEIATFNYPDNMAKGIKRTWEIMIDLIPKIYDTERSVRILGKDGAEKYMKVNSVDPETGQPMNDLSRGKYDVVVTVGPGFATQRQEAVEAYTSIGQSNPLLWQAAPDLIFKAMDLPYADQIAERMKLMLPPQLQQMDGKDVPPEVQQAMMQAEQAMQQVQQHGQLVQKASEELQQEKSAADQAKNEVKLAAADLQVKEAQLQEEYAKLQVEIVKDIAKVQAAVASQIAGLGAAGPEVDIEAERQGLSEQVQAALNQIQAEAAAYMQQAAQTILRAQAVVQPMPDRRVVVRRVNGELVGDVTTPQAVQ